MKMYDFERRFIGVYVVTKLPSGFVVFDRSKNTQVCGKEKKQLIKQAQKQR